MNLKSLVISYNDFKYHMLPIGLFNGLVNLEKLDMRNCQLSRLPDGLFSPLARLQFLNLHFNNILGMNTNTFTGLGNLREFVLDHYNTYKYGYLSMDVFNNFRNLEKFNLKSISDELVEQLRIKFPNIKIN